jgi:hypothetical protein
MARQTEAIQSKIQRYCALDFHLNLFKVLIYKQNGI